MPIPFHPAALREARFCRLLALLLILAAAAVRLAYLACDCPLDLAPDEAHYWDWSRHLDWSYYSKGPLVAYLIRLGCLVAGPWSQSLIGSEMLAVRLPAVVCGSLLLLSLYVLTVQVYRNERLALGVVALALTMPVLAAGSSLMTIDAPYACCWGWALVLGYQAIFRRSAWAWPILGLVIGTGILAKYTMVLFLPSLALFLLTGGEQRALLRRPGVWVMGLIAGACCLPILIWNMQHGWMTVRHVQRLSGQESPHIHWLGPLAFVGGQFALLLGFWFIAWVAALWTHRPWVEEDPAKRYLWWLSVPMFVNFLLFGFKTGGGELNWSITAYISGLVLAAGWLAGQLRNPVRSRRTVVAMTATCALGLGLTVFVHHSEWLRFALAPLSGEVKPDRPYPLRRFDPSCRLRGWRQTLAAEVDRVRAGLRAKGIEPVLAATSWSLPGELAFYCEGHPTVYSVGLVWGDRHSQYDLWHPNPVFDPKPFLGRTFIIVGGISPELLKGFDHVEPTIQITHHEGGHAIAGWVMTVCHGFHGFPTPKSPRTF